MRTGDTPAEERRAFGKRPPDILVTTPESLYLMLTSAAREALRGVEWVIVDEIHALAGDQARRAPGAVARAARGPHCQAPAALGLSATQRPLSVVAGYLGGRATPASATTPGEPRPVRVVDAGMRKTLELEVVVPVEDMAAHGRGAAARRSSRAAPPPRRTRAARSGRSSSRASWSWSAPIARRSSSSTAAASPSASRCASTSWPARRSCAPTTAASLAKSGCRSRSASRTDGCRRSSPRAASSWASTWARSISSSRSNRRGPWRAGCSGSVGRVITSASLRRA